MSRQTPRVVKHLYLVLIDAQERDSVHQFRLHAADVPMSGTSLPSMFAKVPVGAPQVIHT
jgi:hypothetical protein